MKFVLPLTIVAVMLSGFVVSSLANAEAKSDTQASYVSLDPPFVVNVTGATGNHFLQIAAQVKITDPSVADTLKQSQAPIRDAMIMLFSGQKVDYLKTIAGKETLRKQALAAIQKVLKDNTGKPGVDGLYFTGFVIQ